VPAVNRHWRPLLLAGALVALSACGANSSGGSSSGSTLPVIQFVGNSTCPTDNATPYNTNGDGKPVPPNVNSFPPVGQAINEMPHTHVAPPAPVTYNHNPPTSGCHYNLGFTIAPIQNGAYDKPVAPEYWVHNLEHGYTVILYNCPSGCTTQFNQLRTWYRSLPPDPEGKVAYAKVVILPDPTLPVPFAAVYWDWYDPIPVFSLDEVKRFYNNHVGNPPEKGAQ
jgi:Protein of unknown function (DUF3105)